VRRSNTPEAGPEACRQAALNLLARREHSRAELATKLTARGFPAVTVAACLEALEDAGLLATDRFAMSFVRAHAAKGQGPVRIRFELLRKGVDAETAERALAAEACDWDVNARAARRKRFGSEPPRSMSERARQARFLDYRGFTSEQIKAALELKTDYD
jgi:regulatory protein